MTAPARLLSVRLQGFKSFAERTHVEFGPGISAVVGPNGSGKSNLADALRWALGEQGRALRTRKSEDVIWAGSDRRPAVGMADVQLVLDNGDGLLPVEFGIVELGRRLFRSGENEYVLNRQRVRLRDLVDLLDAAHLAENAFLFIGQGMVDQALALRPEERRPLFEEVAGVRRHDRRRRRAEEQLAEATTNLTRVEDVLAELRPQVRRLAAQAEQQASRRDAGADLADALLLAGHARWHAAATRLSGARAALAEIAASIEAAGVRVRELEAVAAGGTERLAAAAAVVETARTALDVARERLGVARVEAAAAEAELAAIGRERARLATELETATAALAVDRRSLAVAIPPLDPELEHEARAAQAAVEDAARELAQLRTATLAAEADRDAALRAEARRAADLDLARRRAAEAARELERADAAAGTAELARDAAHAADLEATSGLEAAVRAEAEATTAESGAAEAVRAAEAALALATREHAEAAARLAAAGARLRAIQDLVEASASDGLAEAARTAGGRAVIDGVVLDPALAPAVAAALGDLATAYVVTRDRAAALASQRGSLLVEEAMPAAGGGRTRAAAGETLETRGEALDAALERLRGGRLVDAVTADEAGLVRGLLATVVWVPDLEAALALQPALPAGWLAVTRDGTASVRGPALTLGRAAGLIDHRAAADALAVEVRGHEATVAGLGMRVEERQAALDGAVAALGRARVARQAASDARRGAESVAQASGRRLEAASREAAWLRAQADRAREASIRAGRSLAELQDAPRSRAGATGASGRDGGDGSDGGDSATDAGGPGLAALERRLADLRAVRDRADGAWRAADASRRDAERDRSRAEATIAMAERRIVEIESASAELVRRAAAAERRQAAAGDAVAEAGQATATAQAELDRAVAEDATARATSGGAERAAAASRESLRAAEDRSRAIEREELEARLGLEAVREQLLVELAGLGELGLRHLRTVGGTGEADGRPAAAGPGAPDRAGGDAPAPDAEADAAALEIALDAAAVRWTAAPPAEDPPSPGRIAALRRRFHELGTANPYALEEHAELSARLEALETQRTDLLGAVDRTRALIAELDELIAQQFRETFGALERAFDARFQQLFGGGFARLTLTEPGDLAATGIEITARPPGKKPQALAMLSGGERALTAVALLFAMLEVRPVPFCVLDEVDAALDEANVGRFTDALRDLGRTTQVIVITHNRGTIETADALYGVTVGEDSVSRVISLRLEEAAAIADRAAGRSPERTSLGVAGTASSSPREATPGSQDARLDGPPAPREPILPAGLVESAPERPATVAPTELEPAG